jgi:hypothetical protein
MPDTDREPRSHPACMDEFFVQLDRTVQSCIRLMKRTRRELARSRRKAERHSRAEERSRSD